MKKIIILIVFMILTGCGNKDEIKNDNIETSVTAEPQREEKDQAKEIVDKMTIEEKVGQMFIVMPEAFDITGEAVTVFSDNIGEGINKYNVGGIILFAKNIKEPEQTKKLINSIQGSLKYPIFIAVDEEGGRVARVGNNQNMKVPVIEPMAQVRDSNRAYEIGLTIGTYLSELGFNLDFAPDADVLTDKGNIEIGDRSFGDNAERCGEMAAEIVKGLQQKGVSAVLKHFPGHGGTESNSHEGLSESKRTLEEMRNVEFIPFKMGIEAESDFVMAAHLSVPNVTGENTPATLSKYMITDLLKNELGFKGIVVSDAMNMGAIVEYFGADEAAVKAVNAGIDILLMPENLDSAYNAVLNGVKNGEISKERLDDACYRIVNIKLKRGIMKQDTP